MQKIVYQLSEKNEMVFSIFETHICKRFELCVTKQITVGHGLSIVDGS